MKLKEFFLRLFSRKKVESSTTQSADKVIKCVQCGKTFVFDAGEQKFFASKGFTDPKRCPKCRGKARRYHR